MSVANPSLPSSWAEVPLSAMAVVNPRGSSTELPDETVVSFLPMKAVAEESGEIDLSESRPLSEVRKGYTQFADGDILVAKITPCMENGKAAVVSGLRHGIGYGSTEFHVVRLLASEFDRRFYFHYIVQSGFRREARRHMTGSAGQLRVPAAYLAEVPVPVPPLPEQRRIVAKVEELFTRLDAGIAALQVVKQQIKRYRQAVLRDAFTGGKAGWKSVRLSEVLSEKPINGRSVKTRPGGFPVLRLTALQARKVILSEFKEGAWSADAASPFLVHDNDFLVARGNGSIRLVGRGGVVPPHDQPVAFPDTMIRLRFQPQLVSVAFVALLWDSPVIREQVERSARTTAGIHKINQSDIGCLGFSLPPLPEQNRIVAEVDRHFSLADFAEKAVDESLAKADHLRQSILKQAFEGNLVPQDPTDEPAERLLERIRAGKAASRAALR